MASIPDFPSFLHIFSPFRPPSFCFSHLSGAPRLILHDCCPPDQELTLQQPRCAIRGHMEGGSWTNNRSWVQGYDTVLGPMERASSLFHERITASGIPSSEPRYRHALFHLLSAETSCYRYWGAGMWTDYGSELCRRVSEIVTDDQ